MGKSHDTGDSGIGGSLRNSLSKFTSRVTVKAPSADELKKAAAEKKPAPVKATPKPMNPPATNKAKGPSPSPSPSPSAPAPAPASSPKQSSAPATQPAKAQRSAPQSSTPQPSLNSQATSSAQTVNKFGNDVVIEGQLRFTDRMVFDGRLKGEITSDGTLTVQSEALIEATVSVKTLLVEGKIIGNIHATGSVQLGPTATVIGDISTGSLTVAPKASFKGRATIGKPTGQPIQASQPSQKAAQPAQKSPQQNSESSAGQITSKMPAPPNK